VPLMASRKVDVATKRGRGGGRAQHPVRRSPLLRWRRLIPVLALLPVLAACSRGDEGIELKAPFNAETEVADVTAIWTNTGQERTRAGETPLKEPEVLIRYRVDVRNRLKGRLFVHLANFRLMDEQGMEIASDTQSAECSIGAGSTEGVLDGSVWIPKSAIDKAKEFRIDHFSVPLSVRGRALYRQYLLERRPTEAAAIDAELARYAAAPPCK